MLIYSYIQPVVGEETISETSSRAKSLTLRRARIANPRRCTTTPGGKAWRITFSPGKRRESEAGNTGTSPTLLLKGTFHFLDGKDESHDSEYCHMV
jgi:hypothetical protein